MLDPGGTRSRPAPGMSAVSGSALLVVEREAEAIVASLRRVRMSGSAHGTPHGRPPEQVPRVRVVTVFVPSRCEKHSVEAMQHVSFVSRDGCLWMPTAALRIGGKTRRKPCAAESCAVV